MVLYTEEVPELFSSGKFVDTEVYLFVYGTLRKALNHPLHHVLSRGAEFVGMGTFQGRLYDLGRYPGALPSHNRNDQVVGEIYAIRDPAGTFPLLDQYEGHRFKRRRITVSRAEGAPLECWTYLYNRSISGKPIISSGDYVKHQDGS